MHIYRQLIYQILGSLLDEVGVAIADYLLTIRAYVCVN